MEHMEARMQQYFEDRETARSSVPPCPFCNSNDDVVTLRDRLRDAEATIEQMRSSVQVPEGWQLVPKEPTEDMECAPDHEDCCTPDAARSAYRAMLAAAPSSPLDIITVTVIDPSGAKDSTR